MATMGDSVGRVPSNQVRLVYHYSDGHDFTTETMLRSQALAYLPLLQATAVDPEHYEAPFATIEFRSA